MSKVALTGIQPSGTPHLGNYLGAIRPAIELAANYDAYYFLADEHALTSVRDSGELRESTYEVAATWIALGLDPSRVVFYRQSDLAEVFELAWIVACVTPKGLLNRAHKYKDLVDANEQAGNTPDDGVSMGLFNYPVLMAADILVVDADLVPVGGDNRQHLEIARDIVEGFNRAYGEVLRLPEGVIDDAVATVTGTDGRKMSKSYDNIIPIFADPEVQRKLVMRIVTDSRPPEEPKDPEGCNVFRLYRHFAPGEEVETMRKRYLEGGIGYAESKAALADALEATFGAARERYTELRAAPEEIDRILDEGAERVRPVARGVLSRVRAAVGLTRA